MRLKFVIFQVSKLIMIVGASMLLPFLCAIYYRETCLPYLYSGLITFIFGFMLYIFSRIDGEIRYREGFAIVTIGWLSAALFGTLPYILSGALVYFPDAFFETISGFTTTGASVITDIESMPYGILFWRSLTHWLGGMGIIVLIVALLSHLGVGAFQLYRAEAPGGVMVEKVRPRIKESAKMLWLIYLGLTVIQVLLLLFCGLSLFDALCQAFGTLATGGFSTKNASLGYFSPSAQWVTIIFMFFAGINFTLYYFALVSRSPRSFWKDEEFRWYVLIILTAITVVALLIPSGETLEATVRSAAFQVISIITTTGFSTTDYQAWPIAVQMILLGLMFFGGCFGSTSGSVKIGRIRLMIKQVKAELLRAIHPHVISPVKFRGKVVAGSLIMNTFVFFFIFVSVFFGSGLLMIACGLNPLTAFSAAITCLANVGPGLGEVGPAGNYSVLPGFIKCYLGLLMLLGRLEIYTVLCLALPAFWRKV